MVVDFWASWCVPCRQEAPLLEATWRAYRDQGVVFVGVNFQDEERAARRFLDEFGITFPNGPDPGSRIAIDYGVYGIPELFFHRPPGADYLQAHRADRRPDAAGQARGGPAGDCDAS